MSTDSIEKKILLDEHEKLLHGEDERKFKI